MKRRLMITFLSLAITTIFLPTAWARTQKDGKFGIMKTKLIITTVQPPATTLPHRTFSIHIAGEAADDSVKGQIIEAVKTWMGGNPYLRFTDGEGELKLSITIQQLAVSSEIVEREVQRKRVVRGQAEVVTETHQFNVFSPRFRALFRCEDRLQGTPTLLDADHIIFDQDYDYNLTLGEIAPESDDDFVPQLIERCIGTLQERLSEFAPSVAQFTVLLGDVDGDRLEEGNKLAQAGQWQAAYDKWNAMPRFQNDKAESYRVFNLGVAIEALAYEAFQASGDAAATLKQLEKAKELYNQALQLKPGEKYFGKAPYEGYTPLTRLELAMQGYQEWQKHIAAKLASRGKNVVP